ncbi:MAG: extracellular solute-binding protein [Bacilli bacterium]|nr:extracellular solute-binding protein [Bacilli bacterium]
MKRKININAKMIKRGVLLLIVFALAGFIIAGIISSFGSDQVLSNSKTPVEYIPRGSYEDFLKIRSGKPADALDDYELNFSELTLPQLEEDIIIRGVDAQISPNSDGFNPVFGQYGKEGNEVDVLETSDYGFATWTFNVPTTGLYNVYIDYFPIKQGGADIERRVIVNQPIDDTQTTPHEVQYDDLNNVKFPRYWTDKDDIVQDQMGNDMKPSQVEILDEQRRAFIRDESGYVLNPYLIYFTAGENTLTLESIRESMAIVSIGITSFKEELTYAEYYELHKDKGVKELAAPIKLEGQLSSERTSPTLYAISDRTDPNNYPVDPVRIKLNAIGGTKWTTPGDAITWNIDMEGYESGLYKIALRAKQDSARGMFSTRRIYINGEIPFSEANAATFNHSTDYRMVSLGNEEEEFLFYLEGGVTNTITLESTLGEYASPISRVQESIDLLNELYLRIIAITTVSPDPYQDYYLYGPNARVHGTIETFEAARAILIDVRDEVISISGDKSDKEAVLDKMILQLTQMIDKPRTITERLKDFANNISALGNWISEVRSQPLQIESIYIYSDVDQLPKANANFFASTWFGIRGFFRSFFFDYESIGVLQVEDAEREVEVWFLTSLAAGREQANAISTLISNSFATFLAEDGRPTTNIKLKVVAPHVLLPSTLAGTGPDVAINVDNGLPVNYAMRNAIMDISVFDEFYEVTGICSPTNASKGLCESGIDYNEGRLNDPNNQYLFFESAMVPYEFDGGYYALPNTQSFLVMFYRTDIFEDRNWEVPETWNQVTSLVRELSISNLQFYLPISVSGASSVVNPIFATMLYQRNGTFYKNDNKESNFDSEEAMIAFEQWTKYYTDYSFPLAASFVNRFKTGETPIGIASYDMFNTITVFAPEIAGKWAFAELPGTMDEFGNINNNGSAFGSATVMMKNADDPVASWDFMRWWVSQETQTLYATELESILGAAARHNTANVMAFKNLAWTRQEQNVLIPQWEKSVGVPEVPGGYYTGRNIENAFREVVNSDANPRETLQEYILFINAEISKKRSEFGLEN